MKSCFRIYGLIFLLLGGFLGCDDEPVAVPVVNSIVDLAEVYNLATNSYRIYHVIDTTFNSTGPIVDEYYKKDQVIGKSTDLQGREIFLIESSIAPVGSFTFTSQKVWSLYVPSQPDIELFLERQEDNRRVLTMKYPVVRGESWDGNLYNTENEFIYRYLSTDTTLTLEAGLFENSIFVLERLDTTSIITNTRKYSVYTPGIGHILRYDKTLITDGPNQEFNPDRSRIYSESLIMYK